MKQTFIIITTIIFLSSCKPSNPETVLGLKLGLPRSYQINEAIQKGNLLTDGDRMFIQYGSTRGYLRTRTNTINNDVEVLTGIYLKFVDTLFIHPNIKNDEWINIYGIDLLKTLYKEKYGQPDSEDTNSNGCKYKAVWKRGDLEIILDTYLDVDFFGKKYYHADATYMYKESIIKKMDEDDEKNNKSI